MSSLKEFLKRQAESQRIGGTPHGEIRREWIEAVDALITELQEWLREADTEGVLTVERGFRRIVERPIGIYEAPNLHVVLGSREVRIEPIARFSIGSKVGDALGSSLRHGRVDITNVEKKHMLFRQQEEAGLNGWIIVDGREYQSQPLTQASFESAIQSLLE